MRDLILPSLLSQWRPSVGCCQSAGRSKQPTAPGLSPDGEPDRMMPADYDQQSRGMFAAGSFPDKNSATQGFILVRLPGSQTGPN